MKLSDHIAVGQLADQLHKAKQNLESVKSPIAVTVHLHGRDVAIEARNAILPALVKHYETQIKELEGKIKKLGVTLP